MCMSPTMEVRSLRSESRQYAMSSCWMNKRVNASLFVWCGSVQYNNLKCLGLWNVILLILFEEHESFNFSCSCKWAKVFLLSVGKSPKEYCFKASLLYSLNDNVFKDLFDFRRTQFSTVWSWCLNQCIFY